MNYLQGSQAKASECRSFEFDANSFDLVAFPLVPQRLKLQAR